jgi:hypothetical protein
MTKEEMEKAYRLLAMHHSELLLHVQHLERLLRQKSILAILKARWRGLWRKHD